MLVAISDAGWGMIATASVAIVGFVVQGLGARGQRMHERQLMKDERTLDKRMEVYLATTRYMLRREDRIDRQHWRDRPNSASNTADENLDELGEIRAQIELFGSTPAQILFAEWCDALADCWDVIRQVQGDTPDARRAAMVELRPRFDEALARLSRAHVPAVRGMARELEP
jgi:hypothetical protein